MMTASLRHTLLFASALQVLGADHEVSCMLERAVQTRDPEAVKAAERAIEGLNETDLQTLLDRFDGLWGDLPVEAPGGLAPGIRSSR
jgi:hypothetical protein